MLKLTPLAPELGSVFADLQNPHELAEQLNVALILPKTKEFATAIRQAVLYIDFSNQVGKIIQAC